MKIMQGNILKEYAETSLKKISKERFLLKYLHNYITSDKDRKVFCLFGLKFTGKTTMALQEIKKINDYENILFVRCDEKDSMSDLRKVIDKTLADNPDCKYIFIDQVTKADKFISLSSFLANDYSARGIRVVLSATESLGFVLAGKHELYDRITFLHTTYISFKEYHYIFDKSLDDYIRYGGILTENSSKSIFCNTESADKYIDSAIIGNIVNSLENCKDKIDLYNKNLSSAIENEQLEFYIKRVMENLMGEFLVVIISRNCNKFLNVGSAQINQSEAYKNNEIRKLLEIKKEYSDETDIRIEKYITDFLKVMDFMKEIPKVRGLFKPFEGKTEYVFMQTGMLYCKVAALAERLIDSEELKVNCEKKEREKISNILEREICEQILEDIIFCQISEEYSDDISLIPHRQIAKYRIEFGDKKDNLLLVLDNNANNVIVIKVRYSDEQEQYLLNEKVVENVKEKTGMNIINKTVIYCGKNCEKENGELALNAEYFLINLTDIIDVLLNYPCVTTINQLKNLINSC